MPIYVNRTNAGKIKCPSAVAASVAQLVREPFMRFGVSCVRIPLGAFDIDFSGICSVYVDRHIRVDLSDDEQLYTLSLLIWVSGL